MAMRYRGYGTRHPGRRWVLKAPVCKVCGKPTDEWHDDAKCEDAWIKRCDEDAGRAGKPC
jgi:hypothetical protein